MTISFAEFKKLPKRDANKNNLEPGKKYYMQDTSTTVDKHKNVYIGVFTHQANGYNYFSQVEFLIDPFRMREKPIAFNAKKGYKFMEVINRITNSSSQSRSISSSRSRSSTKKGGRKHPKRKTVRRHSRK